MSAAPISLRAVLFTGAALLALWLTSFALSFASLGGAALPIALTIAVVKAALVALFFMELLRESLSIKLTILSAAALTLLLMSFMIADILTR